jgi:hypothetical protein
MRVTKSDPGNRGGFEAKDGIARHTKEGYEFQRRAAAAGFKAAVRDRDEPFGEPGFE